MIAQRRAAGRAVRVLVDLRLSGMQGPETAVRVVHWTQTIYEAGDRVAMIVASSLVRFGCSVSLASRIARCSCRPEPHAGGCLPAADGRAVQESALTLTLF